MGTQRESRRSVNPILHACDIFRHDPVLRRARQTAHEHYTKEKIFYSHAISRSLILVIFGVEEKIFLNSSSPSTLWRKWLFYAPCTDEKSLRKKHNCLLDQNLQHSHLIGQNLQTNRKTGAHFGSTKRHKYGLIILNTTYIHEIYF